MSAGLRAEGVALGKDVTGQARSKKPSKDAVLSVRMPIELLKELEEIANREDRPLSMVVRETLHRGLRMRYIPPMAVTSAAPVTVTWSATGEY